jgi:heptosyltransferase-2
MGVRGRHGRRFPPHPGPFPQRGEGVDKMDFPMKIAVFLPNWIGDVVMATPALRALRRQFSGDQIIGVCRPYVSGLLDGAPWLDKVLYLDRAGAWSQRWPAVAWQLRREHIDLAILFPNSFRAAMTAWLGGCRRRVGFNRSLRGCLLTDRLEAKRGPDGRYLPSPIIDDYNRLAEKVGCPDPGRRLELFTSATDERLADRVWEKFSFDSEDDVICLNPGAAFGAAKFWPADYFAQLAQNLVDQRGSRVLVLCGPKERDLARQIVRLSARPTVHSLAEETLSLGLTKALVRRCSLLVTTDSGPRHFAAAFDRPVVSLFGPTFIAWTDTRFAKEIHLQKQVPCGPCQKRVCPTDHRCMTELLPKEVFAAVNGLLARYEPAAVGFKDMGRKAS